MDLAGLLIPRTWHILSVVDDVEYLKIDVYVNTATVNAVWDYASWYKEHASSGPLINT